MFGASQLEQAAARSVPMVITRVGKVCVRPQALGFPGNDGRGNNWIFADRDVHAVQYDFGSGGKGILLLLPMD